MSDLSALTGDRDLRRRLMARVGRPLTAAGDPDEESVARTAVESLVSSVYGAASDAADAEPFSDGPDGRSP